MKYFLALLALLTKNTCLEVKFILKTEFFENNCDGELSYIEFAKLYVGKTYKKFIFENF